MQIKKPFDESCQYCEWFWGEDKRKRCNSICPSASYVKGSAAETEAEPQTKVFEVTPQQGLLLSAMALSGMKPNEVQATLHITLGTIRVQRNRLKDLDIDWIDKSGEFTRIQKAILRRSLELKSKKEIKKELRLNERAYRKHFKNLNRTLNKIMQERRKVGEEKPPNIYRLTPEELAIISEEKEKSTR
jgi:hypothetical protein